MPASDPDLDADSNEAAAAAPAAVPSCFAVCEHINVRGRPDLPGHLFFIVKPSTIITPNQEAARRKLEDAAAVLRAVFQVSHPKLFRDYFTRLLDVAWGVFIPGRFNEDGLSDLTQLKREVVHAAGPMVKASYVRRLLLAVVVAMLLITATTVGIQSLLTFASSHSHDPAFFWARFGKSLTWDSSVSILHLGALMSASMVGLLFASMARNTDLTFEKLMTPDADLIQPWVRLVFFGIAIFIIALTFQLGLVTASLGSLSTMNISTDLLTAILIGLLLGVAERALPSQVEKWSSDLASAAQSPGGAVAPAVEVPPVPSE